MNSAHGFLEGAEDPKVKDRSQWHCLNIGRSGACESDDCTNEPCLMVPHKPADIEFLKHERNRMLKAIETIEKKIAECERENDEAVKGHEG